MKRNGFGSKQTSICFTEKFMLSESKYKLILRSKVFTISCYFWNLNDVDQQIYSILILKQQYEVKSNVRENIFQCFINYWVYLKTPYLTLENISEYDQLRPEFDRMTGLIQLFKQRSLNYSYSF